METYWELKSDMQNAENQKSINEFLLMKKNENREERTIVAYRTVLGQFFEGKKEPISSLTEDALLEWKDGVNHYRASILLNFFNFCMNVGYQSKRMMLNAENQKVINVYLIHMKSLNRRKSTITSHRKTLQKFFREREEPFKSLTLEDMQQWISMQEKILMRSSLNKHLNNLRTFYYYCVQVGYITKSPMSRVRRKKKEIYWVVDAPVANSETRKVLNEYLLSLKVSNYSKQTISTYRYELQRFFKNRGEPIGFLKSDDILNWLIIQQKIWKESTLSTELRILNSFFTYCVEEGYLKKPIIKKRWYPRLPQPVPKYLEKMEIAKIRQLSDKEPLRKRAILEFLLTSGCRVGEATGINRTDVDLENRTARVTGKGKKMRVVHFSEKCALLLERYLESRIDNDPALFVTKYGSRLHTSSIYQMMKELGETAQLARSLHPHRLRHTFATELLAKGADLSFIGDELGHTNLQTTQIYARLPKGEIISMYRKFMG